MATYVYASSQGQGTHSARTKINNILVVVSIGSWRVLLYFALVQIEQSCMDFDFEFDQIEQIGLM
jgi:hypothetical protein